MVCPNCGAEGNTKFCQSCGTPLETPESTFVENKPTETLSEKTKANINNLEEKVNKIDNNKLICAIGMLPSFFWIPLIANRKNKKYAKCASNGLMLSLVSFAIGVVFSLIFEVIGFMPASAESAIYGFTSVLRWIRDILYLGCDILSYVGFVSVFLGKDFKYPVIGNKNIFENLD